MSSSFRKLPKAQRGAALIVALVVVLLVVMLATRVSSDYLVLFRTVENQAELQQARAYLRGAELVAREALLRDLQVGSELDSMLEPWARQANLPLPEGILSACLADLQARLNLNDLHDASGSEYPGEYSAAQKRFVRLLQAVDDDVDSVAAMALANAVFDWLDADDDPRYPGGAETLDYARDAGTALRAPQAYRPANQSFASVSELRLIKGFTPELVAALTPHVTVWGNGNLNLNTMDADLDAGMDAGMEKAAQSSAGSSVAATFSTPTMLRILNTADSILPLSVDGARLLAAARSNSGGVFQGLGLFDTAPFNSQDWELDGVALTSSFFELRAVMQTPRRAYGMVAVLHRNLALTGEPQVTVISRRYGGIDPEGACVAALH